MSDFRAILVWADIAKPDLEESFVGVACEKRDGSRVSLAAKNSNANCTIACSVGGFKGVFLHGVLAAFEEEGFRAKAYAAASSSVLPAASAVIGQTRDLGLDHWIEGLEIIRERGKGMSELALGGIEHAAPAITKHIFRAEAPRFLIAANLVDSESKEETQGRGARRLGRLLLLAAARGDRNWIEAHLTLQLFDSKSSGVHSPLTADNFREVAYASSRMLHAWDIPALIGGRAYIDAFYRCACPVHEPAELDYAKVIALSNEPILYRDIFQKETIHSTYSGVPIQVIRPDFDPVELGVSYTTASSVGLTELYEHGIEKGRSYLKNDANERNS